MKPVKKRFIERSIWENRYGDRASVIDSKRDYLGVPDALGRHKKYHIGAVWLLMMMLKYGPPMACMECPVYRIPLGTCVSGKAAFVIG